MNRGATTEVHVYFVGRMIYIDRRGTGQSKVVIQDRLG